MKTLSGPKIVALVTLMFCHVPQLACGQNGSTNSPDSLESFGSYFLFGWQTNWQGPNWASLSRSWGGNESQNQLDYYWLNFHQFYESEYVGLDFGVGQMHFSGTQVSALSDSSSSQVEDVMSFRFTDETVPLAATNGNSGYWYMGPKTIIYSQANWDPVMDLQGDNYECYIIEKSSITRDELFTRLYHHGGALNYVTTSFHWDGQQSTKYDHFTRPFNGFTQVFAIRDNGWKDPGATETEVFTQVNWIQHVWMTNGIIPNNGLNHFNLGWKTNIEFAGKFGESGCGFSYLNLPQNFD